MMQRKENEQTVSARRFGTGRRLCAFLLAFVLLLGLLPTMVFADEVIDIETISDLEYYLEEYDSNGSGLKLNVKSNLAVRRPITLRPGAEIMLGLNRVSLTADENLDGPMFTVPSGATLTIVGYTMPDNSNDKIQNAPKGFAVVEDGGTLTLGNSVDIENCTAEKGGAIYVKSGGTAILGSDSKFSGWSTYEMNASTISNCTATQGGGIYVEEGGTVRCGERAAVISGCEAEQGGGVYVAGGDVTLKTVQGNSAAQGGGVYIDSGYAACASVTENTAIQGGGVYCNGSYALDRTASVTGNSAEQGGGIFVTGSGSVTAEELTTWYSDRGIRNNTASGNGGAIYISLGGRVSLANLDLRANSAVFNGGAIYVDSPAEQQGYALLKFGRATSIAENTVNGVREDVYLSAPTHGQIGAKDLGSGTDIIVTLPNKGSARGVIRDISSLEFFTIGGVKGGSGASFYGETTEDDPTGHISYDGNVEDFPTLKATLEAGKSVKLLRSITVTKPITIPAVKSGDLKLDLNGNALTAAETLDDRMFTVPNDATFTIATSTGTGTIKGAPMGAVHVQDGAVLKIGMNIRFENCTADNGGGVRVDAGGKLKIIGSGSTIGRSVYNVYFKNCKASGNGGGVFVDGGGIEIALDMCVNFEYCEASCGGGLYLEKKTTTGGLSFSFFHCKATLYGGGLYTAESDSYGECSFQYGTASKGGGIFLAPGAGFRSGTNNVIISNNTALESGGGIYVSEGAKFSITSSSNTKIEYNKADNGGGIYAESNAALVLRNQLSDNQANQKGGLLFLSAGASATICSGLVYGNKAGSRGGAIYMEADSEENAAKLIFNDEKNEKLLSMVDNYVGETAEDICLAGGSADQIAVEGGGIADGIKIHVSAQSGATVYCLKNKEYSNYFIFSERVGCYLLRVDTGINAGDNVLYFGIRYLDEEGIERTQFVYPREASLFEGYELAGGLNKINERAKLVKELTGYSLKNQTGDFVLDENAKGLQPDSTDYYVFTPRHKLKELVRIDVFMRYDPKIEGNKGWTCQGMYFYHVDEFYGVDMAGYYSNQVFLSFKGQVLGYLMPKSGDNEVSVDFTLSQSDELFRIGAGKDADYLLEIPKTPTPYDSKNCEYLFDLEFADKNGAGIEALAANYNDGKRVNGVIEALALRVEYSDLNNRTHVVTMPVVVNAVSWAVEHGYLSRELPVVGIAQQGEDLVFAVTLPDVKELKSCKLIFGNTAADSANIVLSGATDAQKIRLNNLKNEGDMCSLLGMRIYAGETTVSNGTSPAGFCLTPDNNTDPLYCYTAETSYGKMLNQGETKLYLSAYDSKTMSLRPEDKPGNYLVSITTDTMDLAATTNEIVVNIHYVSQSGDARSTGDISLSTQSRDFYGYWPGRGGNLSYQAAMQPGCQLQFLLDAKDVSYFTGATLTIKSDAFGQVDEWQMRDFSIWKFISADKRVAEWRDVGFSDRVFTRKCYTSDAPLAQYPNALDLEPEEGDLSEQDLGKIFLSRGNPSVTITFGQSSRGSTEITSSDPDWDAIRYSMTYEQAHMDLKFGNVMCEYTVKVTVAGNDGVSTENGDAGSNNQFYFMLSFENGTSGYVLANQQLDSDGFRADRTESFTIKTNRDYGTLSAVYVIPDDSNENTKNDKLNVKEIKVIKNSTEGIAKTWTISSVGWIGVGYYDPGAENTIGGRPGRSESDMARIFYVDKQGYSVNILFAMKTGGYASGDPQLKGTMMVDIEYLDNSGLQQHTGPVDVAERIYDYANLTANYYKGSHAKLDSFMVRGNKTDRFIIPIEDLQSITKITFEISPEQTTTWTMEHLDIYKIESDGLLQININDEYQRSNKTTWLCENTATDNSKFVKGPENGGENALGAMERISFQVSSHEIKVDMSSSSWKSTIKREPISKDDKLNVYVFMTDPIPANQHNYGMNAWAYCNHPLQGEYRAAMEDMVLSPDGQIFYALDVAANGISGLAFLELLSEDDSDDFQIGIDHVVVQHVRAGVTIRTYSFELYGNSARSKILLNAPTATSSAETSGDKQTVKIFFSENTPKQTLRSETDDILLSIRYKSSNDMQRGRGDTSVIYSSKYVYLSDVKEETVNESGQTVKTQKYTSIGPGMIAEIDFHEAYVAEIIGISVASVGSIDAAIDSACALCTGEGGNSGDLTWYNFASGARLSNAPYILNRSTDETVMPVQMTFTTLNGLVDMSTEPGASAEIPITMTVWYQNDLKNVMESVTFENLNYYVTDGGFQTGETATVEFFLKNTSGIRYITLEPHSAFSIGAAWELGTVACTTEVGGVQSVYRLKTVNKNILQGHPERVNLATLIVRVETMVYSERSGTYMTQATNSEEATKLEVQLKSGKIMNIVPEIQGTLEGYGFTVSVVEGTSMDADAAVDCYYITSDGTQVVFIPPEVEATYTIRIASEEMPENYCDIVVTVEGVPEEEHKEQAAPAEPTGDEEKQSGGRDDDDGDDEDPEGGSGDTPPEETSPDTPDEAPEDGPET